MYVHYVEGLCNIFKDIHLLLFRQFQIVNENVKWMLLHMHQTVSNNSLLSMACSLDD